MDNEPASPPSPPAPPRLGRVAEWPVLVTLLLVAAGLAAVALHAWRTGTELVGLGLLLAGALRLALPARQLGLLAVRGRALDAALLLGVGFALVALALAIPTG